MGEITYEAILAVWQKFLIALVLVVIAVIAVMVTVSTNLGLGVLGVFVQIAGVLLLSFGLVKTNDDLLMLAQHPSKKDVQGIITHMATERFQIMLALFLIVLGMLLEIFSLVFA